MTTTVAGSAGAVAWAEAERRMLEDGWARLPGLLSAWSANILFAIAAIYLFLHVET